MTKLTRALALSVLFCPLMSAPAAADVPIVFTPMTTPDIMYPVVLNPCPNGKCPAVSGNETAQRQMSSAGSSATSSANLTFSPSAQRRKQNLARFIQKSNGDPSMKAFAAKSGQLFPKIERMMGSVGLSANNVADTYALWWISAWDASHGVTVTRPASTYQAVKRQAARAILGSSQFQGATPALKQEMAEALIAQTVFIDSSVEDAKNDPQKLRLVGAAVAKGARRMGIDLSAMTLTPAGFRSGQ
ncbi:DUF6683 family protein [Novosphingobium beihaiensis]|uniref:Uncharacterized protein n=1 Tax=Novosphingobium beihaiensis TaxID=2930389 RepID=A0ABT0BVG8_9SPHN|nr:DUF6683 family protein [Novosphingobium beihaiensis]MCJ2189072.1 hypothetical protein [Novosphingobium beihaiensis]